MDSRPIRLLRTLAIGAALLGGSALALPAASAATSTSVAIGSAAQSGTAVTVSGTASFGDQPFQAVGTDGTGDTFAPGEDTAGGDLTGAAIQTTTGGKVVFQWAVAQLPPAANGAPTGILYGWDFCVDGGACFEVDAQRTGPAAGTADPYGNLWACADATCTPADQTLVTDAIPVTFTASPPTVALTVSESQITASPGSVISPTTVSSNGAAFTAVGDLSTATYEYDFGDGVDPIADYTVAAPQVSLTLDTAGGDPAAAAYVTTVAPAADGTFSGSVDATGLAAGTYQVDARACFGEGNCAYATAPVTIG